MRCRAAAHWVIAAPFIVLAPLGLNAQEHTPAMAQLAESVLESLDPDSDDHVPRNEFLAALAEPDRAQAGLSFETADADHDAKLSEKEFLTLSPGLLFRLLDRDHDGELKSIEEIVPAPAPVAGQPAAPPRSAWSLLRSRLAFEGVDADRNGRISEKEFHESLYAPSLAGNDSESPLPDAVLEEGERVLSVLLPSGQDSIAAEAWKSTRWEELGPDWQPVALQNPDTDADGKISRDELRKAVEVALGVRLPDGLATRLPNGLVFKNFEFGYLDENKDRKLSPAEYIAKFQPNRESALANFTLMDLDKDGLITPAEAVKRMRDDMLGTFLRYDADRDGKVTPEEVAQNAQTWEKNAAAGLFPGFDQDGNGSLSYREFAWTPPQCRVVDWNVRRRDVNGDMKLSYDEFRPAPDPFAAVLMRRAFRFRDVDRDGLLSYEEFPFDRDVSRVPAEVAFQQLDRDRSGELSHAELFTRQEPEAQDLAETKDHYGRLVRSQTAFAAMDADRNGQLSKKEYDGPFRLSLSGASTTEPIPDPILGEAERVHGLVLSGRSALRIEDWKGFDWKSVGPDWEHLALASPDADKDGSVTPDEARRTLETALGIRRADGTAIRLPTGHLLRNLDFRTLDTNGDNRLSQDEYLSKWQPDRDVAIRRFMQDMDRNKDGFATLDELVLTFREDLVATFVRFDTDRDGKVTPDETARNSAAWEKNAIAGLFPGFDQDGDGGLSLAELAWTPILNRVLDWNAPRADQNGDARLSYNEFRPSAELFGSVLARRFFRVRDLDRDGFLSHEEFPFTIDPAAASPEIAFRTRDLDSDGAWSFEEALGRPAPKTDDAEGLKTFQYARLRSRLAFDAIDVDRSGTVSLEELRQSPYGRTLQGAWGHPIPDVIQDETERVLALLLPQGAESIPADTWPKADWAALGPDWATLVGQKPDQDGDQKISRQEARRVVEIAMGVRLADGTLIRLPTGFALKNVEFGHKDANKDGKLSQAEYAAKSPLDPETTLKNFTSMDKDKDGLLSRAEAISLMKDDLVATFLRFDADHDGRITSDEVARHAMDWEKNAAAGLFPGFDLDGDGVLSYQEFGWTPVQVRALDWNQLRKDYNGDLKLSFEEFRLHPDLFASVVTRKAFRLRDVDRNGVLTHEEYPFEMDPAKAPPEIAFKTRDQDSDGHWTFEEALARSAPKPEDTEGLKTYRYNQLRTRLAFNAADADHDGTVSLDELKRSPYGWTLQGAWGNPLPDIIFEEAERVLALLLPDRQEAVTSEAWSKADWAALGPDWAALATHKPDRNGDGKVSRDEARQAIETALGIRQMDGTLIRLSTGFALKNVEFGHKDTNKDGKLSQAEYAAKSPLDPETTLKNFAAMDKDKDGLLVPIEAITHMKEDLVATFLRFDADHDGRITTSEITRNATDWEKYAAAGLFPGFDLDGDAALSYQEFGWTPVQVRAVDWNQVRKDYNGDLKLSFEEFRLHPDLFASVVTRRAFRLRDVDRNGVLTHDEYPFEMDPAKSPPEIAFKTRDLNTDGRWTFEEAFARSVPQPEDTEGLKTYRYNQLRTRLAFDAADADHDGTVSLDELKRSSYGRTLQGAWGHPIPDVILDEVVRALAHVLPEGAELIPADNWPNADWTALGPDWATLATQKPDQDGDQKVSKGEARRVVEIALGVRLADGTPIRLPTGHSLKVLEFGWLDENKDRKLTQGEYAAKFQPSPEVALKNFATLDQNKDGVLTTEEAAALMRDDLIGAFLRYDADHDGRVSPREVAEQSSEWEKNLIPGVFPGFDENGDGTLSYREFSWTPLQTRVVDWNQRRKDYNHDTKLSFEEFRVHPDLFASVLMRKAFRLRDLNGDEFLTYEEFPFDVDSRGLPKQIAFEQKDVNRDGHLAFSETFTQPRPQGPGVTNEALRAHHARKTRCLLAFRAADLDNDNKLSSAEFMSSDYALTSLGDVPSGPVPDPLLQLAERVLSQVFPVGTTSVTSEEWQGFSWQQFGPDWEGTEVAGAKVDRDGDGVIAREEARETIEIALGIRLADGTLIRLPTGHLFRVIDFGNLDVNKDRKLTASEYVARFQPSRDVALKKFEQLDGDRDSLLTPAELVGTFRDDLIGTWTYFDVNFDGRITSDELSARARPWELNTVDALFPGFDENHDGDLSYDEFALTPIQNRVLDWNRRRRDTDNDTYLSYKEFRGSDAGPFASILMRRFFRVRDQNGDGKLSIDEYAFDMDASKLPIEIAFKIQDKDKNEKLSLTEIFTDPRPKSDDPADRERYEMRLAAAETRFLADDKDHDGGLSAAEFQQSREASLAAVERKTQALSRHRRSSSGSDGGWFFPSILAVNAVVLLAGGWYLMRRPG